MNKRTLHPNEKRVNRRRYDSPVRRKQAERTRGAILEAARDLFVERGYTVTTITGIAERAEVSPQTVYGIFGGKRGLLTALMDETIGGVGGPARLMETEGPQRMRVEPDQRAQLRMLAGGVTGILERAGPLFLVMRDAATADEEIGDAYAALHAMRYRNMGIMVGWVVAHGPFKAGLSVDEATDVVWALTSADLRHLLRDERGWSAERYEAWLGEALIAALLP